ncbi:hypothetical protein B9Z55_005768 [Caenorhabditis nigoni]|uniref:Uncharacterized protein n=1 Tax=Caenorhabditis nigoni TaxID=1611254 RepID=A0A2G5V2P9_9PELO|nr:hypothetical protein B9Z55_005768 [Caenorhabditis nigoni]
MSAPSGRMKRRGAKEAEGGARRKSHVSTKVELSASEVTDVRVEPKAFFSSTASETTKLSEALRLLKKKQPFQYESERRRSTLSFSPPIASSRAIIYRRMLASGRGE